MLSFFIEIDRASSSYFISYIDDRPLVRELIDRAANAEELKGMISALIIWYLWFPNHEQKLTDRSKICAVILATVVSIAFGRALANFLPFRLRPGANELVMGENVIDSRFFDEWSSMPSDHSVMFFTLAAGFFLISRTAGILALLHATLIVCLPRFLLGLHYLSDILVGAVIGTGLSLLLVPFFSKAIERNLHPMDYPARIVYPVLFFVTFNIATMFNGVRAVGGIIKDLIS